MRSSLLNVTTTWRPWVFTVSVHGCPFFPLSCSHRPLFSVHRRQECSRQLLFCRWVFPKRSTKKTHRRSIVCSSCDATNFLHASRNPTRSWRCAWGMNNMSSFHPCCSSVAACFHFHLLVSPRQARRTKRWTPLIITWPPKEHEVLLLDRFFLFLLCWHFCIFLFLLCAATPAVDAPGGSVAGGSGLLFLP